MRIYTKAGDLAHRMHIFSDSQPHFVLETAGPREFNDVTIEAPIRTPSDLLVILMAADVLRANGYGVVNFDCRYLLGARMDRAIDLDQPFSLALVARLINSAGFNRVRILDAHSDVALRVVKNATNVLPTPVLTNLLRDLPNAHVVIPDKGATNRVLSMCPGLIPIQCFKDRDVQTGKITGMRLGTREGVKGNHLLIVDDICDGGATFTVLAKMLREAGARRVDLFVTHAILSKGVPLPGIDQIYTTDSYYLYTNYESVTVIPVSMKELG